MSNLIDCFQTPFIQLLLIDFTGTFCNLLSRCAIGGRLRFLFGRGVWFDGFHWYWFKGIRTDNMTSFIDCKCGLGLGWSWLFDYITSLRLILIQRAHYEIFHMVFLFGLDHTKVCALLILSCWSLLTNNRIGLFLVSIGTFVTFIVGQFWLMSNGWSSRPSIHLILMFMLFFTDLFKLLLLKGIHRVFLCR